MGISVSGGDYTKAVMFYPAQLFAIAVNICSVNVPSYLCWEQAGFYLPHSFFATQD